MSDLYKEAIADAKKLRDLAEEDAKKQLLERFTPYVKEMINKDLKNRSSLFSEGADLKEKMFAIGEQEEDPTVDPMAQQAAAPTATGAAAPAPLAQDPAATPAAPLAPPVTDVPAPDASAAMADTPVAPPVEPIGSSDLGSTTLDQLGDDGKIVVDVNDLFSTSAPEAIAQADIGAPEAEPTPGEGMDVEPSALSEPTEEEDTTIAPETASLESQPTETPVTAENVINQINEVAYKIDVLCLSEGGIKDLTKNYHKQRLFSLLEQVDYLKENGLISGRQAKILENKLEFLFLKLKEANLANSYKKIYREDNDTMAKSLKSIAAQLFLEENDPVEKTQSSADARVGANGKHAMSASGNTVGAKADSEHTVSTKEKEIEWDEQDPNGEGVLEENAEAGGESVHASAGFGDTEESPEVEFEVSEAELMEAIRQLRKENVQKKVKALKESLQECEMEEEGTEEGGMYEDFDGVDMHGDEEVGAVEGDVDLQKAQEDLQAAFAALGLGDVHVDLDHGMGDDEEIEIVDDEDLGSEEEGMSLHDGEEEGEEEEETALMEAIARKKAAAIKESARVQAMKKELNENNLFTAKTVFLNKILMRESLSKQTTRKVVELLDKARTLAEAKEIYQKILARLNEGKVAASKSASGSASVRATRPGSSLNESVNRTQQSGSDISVERWQQLSGIKKVDR